MMKKALFLIISALMIFSCMSGCESSKANNGELSIVTTCFPPYDFARAVKGDDEGITMLLSTGSEAHSYEPTPLDILKIQECDIFIYIGGEDEVWVDKILESIDTEDKKIVKLIDTVELLEEEAIEGSKGHEHIHSEEDDEDCHECEEEHHHEHDGHEHGYDEHIWTTPHNAIKMTQAISEAFISKDSGNEAVYSKNTDMYISRLERLDEDFREMRENASDNLIVIGDRFPFRYLSAEYDLDYYAAFSGCSSESEPGVYTMAFLIDKILENKSDYVFYLEMSTQRLADKLADATGAKTLSLESCHNITKEDFDNNVTYIDLMRRNLENLREALS